MKATISIYVDTLSGSAVTRATRRIEISSLEELGTAGKSVYDELLAQHPDKRITVEAKTQPLEWVNRP